MRDREPRELYGNAKEYLDYMIDFRGEDVEIVQGAQATA